MSEENIPLQNTKDIKKWGNIAFHIAWPLTLSFLINVNKTYLRSKPRWLCRERAISVHPKGEIHLSSTAKREGRRRSNRVRLVRDVPPSAVLYPPLLRKSYESYLVTSHQSFKSTLFGAFTDWFNSINSALCPHSAFVFFLWLSK